MWKRLSSRTITANVSYRLFLSTNRSLLLYCLRRIGDENCCILRISEPIKSHYAKENNLDLNQLMSENAYKENYRIEMIKWSDNVRLKEPGYFCEAACSKSV